MGINVISPVMRGSGTKKSIHNDYLLIDKNIDVDVLFKINFAIVIEK